jgi:hypothetical protein
MATCDEILDEQRRARQVRLIVDFTCTVIMQSHMARADAEALVQAARDRVLELFPGREDTYEILYARRFQRILDEFAPADPPAAGTLLPFPSPAGFHR